jgi:hypothetical protein
MKSITILQIIFDVILIALNGYLGFTGQSIYLIVALLWCVCLWLHILSLNTYK